MKRSLFVLVASVLVIISCSPKNQTTTIMKPNATFDNTRWKMIKIAGLDPFPTLEKDAYLQFDRTTNRFRGNAGCNNFNGAYTLHNGKLSLGPAAMTKMFCAGEGMKVEDLFSQMMGKIDSYVIVGDRMVLKTGNRVVAEFEALYL